MCHLSNKDGKEVNSIMYISPTNKIYRPNISSIQSVYGDNVQLSNIVHMEPCRKNYNALRFNIEKSLGILPKDATFDPSNGNVYYNIKFA